MTTQWKWAATGNRSGKLVLDKVFIATALLSNMYNVYREDLCKDYFQENIDLLDLTSEQKAEVLKFIFLTTMSVYSKRDYNKMLPKYLHALKISENEHP